jgi:hypothetical protein
MALYSVTVMHATARARIVGKLIEHQISRRVSVSQLHSPFVPSLRLWYLSLPFQAVLLRSSLSL